MGRFDMNHMEFLRAVVGSDIAVLKIKEATYRGSWKQAGGRSAWFMLRRNMDRLVTMMAPPQWPESASLGDLDAVARDRDEGAHLTPELAGFLARLIRSEDLFLRVGEHPGGEDGTVLAVLRDMRRYALLVEAEMLAEGVVPNPEVQVNMEAPEKDYLKMAEEAQDQVLRSALQRVLRVPGEVNIYDLMAHMMGVGRGEAKSKFYRVLYGVGTPEDEKIQEHMIPMRLEERQRTPEDGAHHSSLFPWMVDRDWAAEQLKAGAPVGARDSLNNWWRPWGQDTYVLETVVPRQENSLPPAMLAPLYRNTAKWYVIDIHQVPPDLREAYPRLHREVNSKELEELPDWQQPMYKWYETENKWKLDVGLEDWARDN